MDKISVNESKTTQYKTLDFAYCSGEVFFLQ